jgi:prepilin-type N-terminal cleavage/methylation domain-containing protein
MRNKSFTLIELLVVIAVIGLLASLIFVNLTGTRSKANIARGLQFSQSVHNALGSEAVGVWNFDEGSGTITNDSSGYNNHGTLTNGPIWRCSGTDSNYTPSGHGCSLQFNGTNTYVEIFSNINLPSGSQDRTVSAWVYMQNYTTPIAHVFHYGNNLTGQTWGIAIWNDGKFGAHEWNVYDRYGNVPLNQWTMLAITLSGNNIKNHYLNGILVGTGTYTPNTSLVQLPKIGMRVSPGEYFNG